jgi:G3E family GTPase
MEIHPIQESLDPEGLLTGFSRREVMADVILNDVSNADLDAASIDQGQAASVAALSASCACCESLDELVALCKTAAGSRGDLLLIELNGTADPLVLVETFSLLKEDLLFYPIVQICVIDVRYWGKRGKLNRLERRQMEGAGMYLLSHTNNSGNLDIREVASEINNEYPESLEVTAKQFLDAFLCEGRLLYNKAGQLCHGSKVAWHDAGSSDLNAGEVHLLSHQVESCQFSLPSRVRRIAIERLLSKLPIAVLRAKALVKTVEEPGMRWLFQRSGSEVSPSPIPVRGGSTLPASLLCVGWGLDKDEIRGLVIDEFGGASGKE